jgi:hypothetical protein
MKLYQLGALQFSQCRLLLVDGKKNSKEVALYSDPSDTVKSDFFHFLDGFLAGSTGLAGAGAEKDGTGEQALRDELESAQAEVASVKMSLGEVESKLSAATEAAGSADAGLQALQDDLTSAKAEAAGLTEQMSEAEGKLEKRKARVQALQEELKQAQSDAAAQVTAAEAAAAVAGALVGYVTNWIAIKLLFEPAEPVEIGPLTVQGLFESRQKEVSEEFGQYFARLPLKKAAKIVNADALEIDWEEG